MIIHGTWLQFGAVIYLLEEINLRECPGTWLNFNAWEKSETIETSGTSGLCETSQLHKTGEQSEKNAKVKAALRNVSKLWIYCENPSPG